MAKTATILMIVLFFLSACERQELIDPKSDVIPPYPPSGLVVQLARDGEVGLEWQPNTDPDFFAYIVYRMEPLIPDAVPVDTTMKPFFVDKFLSYDTTYRYFLTALDEAENESLPSDTVSATPVNRNPPERPMSFYAFGSNIEGVASIRLEWAPNTDADLAGYRLYRSRSQPVEAVPRNLYIETDSSFVVDTMVTPTGTRWYYVVTAVDRGALESRASRDASDLVTDVPELLSPPDGAGAPSWPFLSWKTVPGSIGYIVFVLENPAGSELWKARVSSAGTGNLIIQYTGPPLTIGRRYWWRVASVTTEEGVPNALSPVHSFQVEQ
ncbi:MAG: hypothetical protein GXO82_06435 [Chlorobi bacterium]|nr:hypothetical protein [Chlorobiota bacterium]